MKLNKQEFKTLVMLSVVNIDGNIQSEEVSKPTKDAWRWKNRWLEG